MDWYNELTHKCSLLLDKLKVSHNKKLLIKIQTNANIKDSYCYQFITDLGFLADSLALKHNTILVSPKQLAPLRQLLEKIAAKNS